MNDELKNKNEIGFPLEEPVFWENIADKPLDLEQIKNGRVSPKVFVNLKQMTTTEGEATAKRPQNGSMFYDSTLHVIKVYINGAWETLSTV